MITQLSIWIPFIIGITGAIIKSSPLIILGVLLICASVIILVKKGVTKDFYWSIWTISITLLLTITLSSSQITGTDSHLEIYYSDLTKSVGWDPNIKSPVNGTLSVTLLIPGLAELLKTELIWIYKVVIPLLFSTVPLMLLYIYSKYTELKKAYIAVFFFIGVPTFFLELTSLARQEVAEVFLVGLFTVGLSTTKIRFLPLMILMGVLVLVSHYSTFMVMLVLLGGTTFICLIMKKWKKSLLYGGVIVAILPCALIYYTWVAGGSIGYAFGFLGNQQVSFWAAEVPANPPEYPGGVQVVFESSYPTGLALWSDPLYKEPLVSTALGLDFMKVDAWGKAYRILQYIVEGLLIWGCIWILRKKRDPELLGLCGSMALVVLLCLIVPGISSIVGMSRLYHYALIPLALAIAIGVKRQSLLLGVIIPYFVFNTGVPFELSHQPNIEKVNIPYSLALSSERTDCGGFLTPDDKSLAITAWKMGLTPIYADTAGLLVLQEKMGEWNGPLFLPIIGSYPQVGPKLPDEYPYSIKDGYLFLRTYNELNKTITQGGGIGVRKQISYEDCYIKDLIKGKEPILICGDSKIYKIESLSNIKQLVK